ncbi:MAG TPA: hypothetical protein VNA89_03960 [Gemmatimonadaceae bacterium]|nr:hypothetical protein [Gemmatimonadaceae bacterium]
MMRALAFAMALTAALAAAVLGMPSAADAQERAARFEVTRTGDSTFAFPVVSRAWVRPGLRGIVVDPRRRDVLVARFSVIDVDGGTATALITGQTSALTTDHVVILEEPRRPAYTRGLFWGGVAVGMLIGLLAGGATD